MFVVPRKFKTLLQTIPSLYSHPYFPFYVFLELALLAIFFGKAAPIEYRIKTKKNPCGKVIFSYLKDYKPNLHHFLYATLLYATPDWDLIQGILFINEKQCFASFLQEKSSGGGGVGASYYKWCANDILKITLILKIMLLLPHINKNFPFPSLCSLLLLTFWHSYFYWLFCNPPLIAYFRFPSLTKRANIKG